MIIPLEMPALSPAALALSVLRKFWRPIVGGSAALLLILYARHEHARADKESAQVAIWRDAEHNWRRAYTIQRNSFDVLHSALQEQNAAVQRLKADSDARQAAGKAALDATGPRNAVREGLARAIETAAPSSSADCRTPATVMAAKGEL